MHKCLRSLTIKENEQYSKNIFHVELVRMTLTSQYAMHGYEKFEI